MKLYTCKCCGFKTLTSDGNYDICDICDWEDDPVQNKNPNIKIGANKNSLYEKQLQILLTIPLKTNIYKGFIRDKKWHPLGKENINNRNIKNGLDYFNES